LGICCSIVCLNLEAKTQHESTSKHDFRKTHCGRLLVNQEYSMRHLLHTGSVDKLRWNACHHLALCLHPLLHWTCCCMKWTFLLHLWAINTKHQNKSTEMCHSCFMGVCVYMESRIITSTYPKNHFWVLQFTNDAQI
jgi:hypothetical protein